MTSTLRDAIHGAASNGQWYFSIHAAAPCPETLGISVIRPQEAGDPIFEFFQGPVEAKLELSRRCEAYMLNDNELTTFTFHPMHAHIALDACSTVEALGLIDGMSKEEVVCLNSLNAINIIKTYANQPKHSHPRNKSPFGEFLRISSAAYVLQLSLIVSNIMSILIQVSDGKSYGFNISSFSSILGLISLALVGLGPVIYSKMRDQIRQIPLSETGRDRFLSHVLSLKLQTFILGGTSFINVAI